MEEVSINSRTGLVCANVKVGEDNGTDIIKRKPVNYKGRVRIDLEPGIYDVYGFLPSDASYHFWYY